MENDWLTINLVLGNTGNFSYQVPPPSEIIVLDIDPVELVANSDVVQFVVRIELSLYNQVQPLEEVGKFENLPVPSSHDSETGKTSITWLLDKFWCSVENNCKLANILFSLL